MVENVIEHTPVLGWNGNKRWNRIRIEWKNGTDKVTEPVDRTRTNLAAIQRRYCYCCYLSVELLSCIACAFAVRTEGRKERGHGGVLPVIWVTTTAAPLSQQVVVIKKKREKSKKEMKTWNKRRTTPATLCIILKTEINFKRFGETLWGFVFNSLLP